MRPSARTSSRRTRTRRSRLPRSRRRRRRSRGRRRASRRRSSRGGRRRARPRRRRRRRRRTQKRRRRRRSRSTIRTSCRQRRRDDPPKHCTLRFPFEHGNVRACLSTSPRSTDPQSGPRQPASLRLPSQSRAPRARRRLGKDSPCAKRSVFYHTHWTAQGTRQSHKRVEAKADRRPGSLTLTLTRTLRLRQDSLSTTAGTCTRSDQPRPSAPATPAGPLAPRLWRIRLARLKWPSLSSSASLEPSSRSQSASSQPTLSHRTARARPRAGDGGGAPSPPARGEHLERRAFARAR